MSIRVKAVFMHFKELRYYIVVAALIFILGIYVGYASTPLHDYLHGQIESLGQLAEELTSLENANLWLFLFIFLNNAIKSIVIIYAGVLFGILPVVFLLLNGMVLGYIYMLILQENGSVWQLVVGILPHGIIELPVVIIACAYGIRFGVIILKQIFQAFIPKRYRHNEIIPFLKSTLPLMVFLVVTLFIAAIIETTVTRWLLSLW
jgi:stage II sporulation protein M